MSIATKIERLSNGNVLLLDKKDNVLKGFSPKTGVDFLGGNTLRFRDLNGNDSFDIDITKLTSIVGDSGPVVVGKDASEILRTLFTSVFILPGSGLPTDISTEPKQDVQIEQADISPVYRYFELNGASFPDEFATNVEFSYFDGSAMQIFSVDLRGTPYPNLAAMLAAINSAQSFFVFEVAPPQNTKQFPFVSPDQFFGIKDGTLPVSNFGNGTLTFETGNSAIPDDSYTTNYLATSSVQSNEKQNAESLILDQARNLSLSQIYAKLNTATPVGKSLTRTSGSGTLLSKKYVSILNDGAANGLVDGTILKPSQTVTYPIVDDLSFYNSITYDATGTEFLIQTIG